VQSRISNALALGVMSCFGLGTLTWYYAHAMLRDSRDRETARAESMRRTQGDLALPALGRIDPPPAAEFTAAAAADLPGQDARDDAGFRAGVRTGAVAEVGAAATPLPLPETLPAWATPAQAGSSAPKTAAELVQDRQLAGAVFAAQTSGAPAAGAAAAGAAAADDPASAETSRADFPRSGSELRGGGEQHLGGDLGALLRPTATAAAHALVLPGQRLLLPKGAFIDCTLETAIDSTLPGMTTCVTATDTFGADGKVVLLERGTKLVGEVRGQVQQGAARLFVLWTQARTPTGVIVPLDSPGADELGRAGLAGDVNRHFWQRFGAAILVSVIDGAVQAAVQSTNSGNGAVIYSPSGSQSVVTEVLKSTVDIPPTVVKPQGDRVQVLVARDVDFTAVYALKPAPQP
jgi:type IV secretion system protein VirB10